MSRTFHKEIPGAVCRFLPDEFAQSADDGWDIRISLPEQPLDDAFYMTVDDPAMSALSIERLLEDVALNTDLRGRLDIGEYAELPFLQEELAQYWANWRRGLIELSVYVNHNPAPGPVALTTVADDVMGTCRYLKDTESYRVLDLVFVPDVPAVTNRERDEWRATLEPLHVLLCLDCLAEDDAQWERFEELDLVWSWLERRTEKGRHLLTDALDRLKDQGHIVRGMTTDGELTLTVSESGYALAEACWREAEELDATYAPYASVSIRPCALGVPEGFDARLQLMTYDGLDVRRAATLCILYEDESLVDPFELAGNLEKNALFMEVRRALAYQTNFTADVLDELKTLA